MSAAAQQRLGRRGLVVFVVMFAVYIGRELVPGVKPLFLDYYTFALAMGIAYGGLLLSVVLRPTSQAASALSRPAPRFVGDVSYSVYLLHNPIILGLLVPWAQHSRAFRRSPSWASVYPGRAAGLRRVVLVRGASVPPAEG